MNQSSLSYHKEMCDLIFAFCFYESAHANLITIVYFRFTMVTVEKTPMKYIIASKLFCNFCILGPYENLFFGESG